MLQFTVPGRPIPKGRPRVGAHGTITPQRTKDYEQQVGYAALQAMPPESRTVPLYPSGDIYMSVTFYTSTGDIDNLAKSILDGLNGVVWMDDSQVVALHLFKHRCSKEEQRAEITIERFL